MNKIQVTFATISIAFAGLGFAAFFMLIPEANGAPQEAALSAMILAVVVPVYVIARGVEMIANVKRAR
jgi:hypothetical protein